MGWITRFFRRTPTASPSKPTKTASASSNPDIASRRRSAPVTSAELRAFVPCNQLSQAELEQFLPHCRRYVFPPGERLFTRGAREENAWYLSSGEIELDFGKQTRTVDAFSAAARYPLVCGQPYAADGVALTEVEALRIPNALMLAAVHKKRARPIEASLVAENFKQLPDELRQSEVFYTFWRTYRSDSFQLPPLPQVALRLRKAMAEDIGVGEAARIVQTDPVVAARLIEIANSPFYRGMEPVTTCQQAIGRIGLIGTRSLVTSLTLKQMFRSDQPQLQRWLNRLWQESVRISCFSYVLGLRLPGIDAEQALLAGLMSHIGALPFLYFAGDFPADSLPEPMMTAAIATVKGPLGVQLLSAWGFPEEVCRTPAHCDDWYYCDEGSLSLSDLVILANWHAKLGRVKTGSLPPIETLPVYQKLDLRAISPEFSLDLLHGAKREMEQVHQLFH